MSETGQIIYLDLLNFNDILDFNNGIGQLRIYFSYLVTLRRSRMQTPPHPFFSLQIYVKVLNFRSLSYMDVGSSMNINMYINFSPCILLQVDQPTSWSSTDEKDWMGDNPPLYKELWRLIIRKTGGNRGHQSPTVTKPSCTGEPLTYRTIMLSHMDNKQHQKNLIAKPFTRN